MAKFIILFFFIVGSGVSYLTYYGVGQERIVVLEKESIRANSSRSGRNSSYNSSSYGYGK